MEDTVQMLSDHGIVTVLDMHQQLGPDWAIAPAGYRPAPYPSRSACSLTRG